MYCPSGDHIGEDRALSTSFVILRAPVPSAFTSHRLSPPSRSEMNAIVRPSGLQRGMQSHAIPLVRRVAVPPAIGMV